ncbi:hypothetical protein QVA78_03015 [Staphylococcus haemolyticus]|uniref:hypothetical protein n=1 Tax=Staphylococcus haemolyticus TaxID=1283 RepID=UPI002903C7EE|nr:hypothetical protein [Staphylococcus haemolyticus]MDU0443786.1 hypothetical protein [Staphylococcus haemolyticus]
MAEPTLDELVAFMKRHGVEKVDSITDEKSAIKHFRAASRLYKEERDSFRNQRDELINDMAETKRKARAFEEIKEAADNEKLNGFVLYDNDSFIDKLNYVFNETEAGHER